MYPSAVNLKKTDYTIQIYWPFIARVSFQIDFYKPPGIKHKGIDIILWF